MPDQIDRDPFYVGYLSLPRAIKKFIVPWLVGNVVLAIGIAAVIAQQHRDPGDGFWDTSFVARTPGVLIIDPYPMLRTEYGTYFLVEQGKFGAQGRAAELEAGAFYEVAGYIISEREGRTVIEIDGTMPEPIKRIEPDEDLRWLQIELEPESFGTHTLRGEIVDPKCYLGVMQPGDGKTHKTCATLCIKGGIPPMFLVRDKQGETAAYLLTDAEGNAIPESVHPYIADPVELTGRVLREGDLLILRADLDSIRRLTADD